MNLINQIKNKIKENIAFNKNIKNIEKEEYKKAKILEAERLGKEKARIETNKKIKDLKSNKKSFLGLEMPKIKSDKIKPIKFNSDLYSVMGGKNVKKNFNLGKQKKNNL